MRPIALSASTRESGGQNQRHTRAKSMGLAACLALGLSASLSACSPDSETASRWLARPTKADAIALLEKRQAADGDMVVSADLNPIADNRFEGMVKIKSHSGEVTTWACKVQPPRAGSPIGVYSCYLDG